MTKKIHFISLLLLTISLTGCEVFKKVTERKVSFDEYKESAFKVDTNHAYDTLNVSGYTNEETNIDESYSYDSVLGIWVLSSDNKTSLGLAYITNVSDDAKEIDINYTASTIEEKFEFYVGISNACNYTYKDGDDIKQVHFDDKYGMITKYYFKDTDKVLSFDFTYSTSNK